MSLTGTSNLHPASPNWMARDLPILLQRVDRDSRRAEAAFKFWCRWFTLPIQLMQLRNLPIFSCHCHWRFTSARDNQHEHPFSKGMVRVLMSADAVNLHPIPSLLVSTRRFLQLRKGWPVHVSIGRGSDGYAGHESTKLARELCHEILLVHSSEYEVLLTDVVIVPGVYHAMTWPQISFVAEDHKGRIVGYVLAKMYVAFSVLHPCYEKHHAQRRRLGGR